MDKEFKIDTEHNKAPYCGYAFGSLGVKNFNWIAAIDAWDYCDPNPLAEMLKNHTIPQELRPNIAEIILSNRKPNKKRSSQIKTTSGITNVASCFRKCSAINWGGSPRKENHTNIHRDSR